MRSGQAGFTFIELLCGIAVAAILIAVAAPSYGKLIASNKLAISANELLGATQRARLQAISRNLTVTFCAGTPDEGCHGDWSQAQWISYIDADANGRFDGSDTLLETSTLPRIKSMQLSANGPFNRSILFRPRGNATWPSGAFAAGRLRICVPGKNLKSNEIVLIGSGRTVLEKRDFNDDCPVL